LFSVATLDAPQANQSVGRVGPFLVNRRKLNE
jgi:hypothetical protein